MSRRWILGVVAVTLFGCAAPQPLSSRLGPAVLQEQPGIGQAVVSIRWPAAAPRGTQVIPMSAVAARLSVFDASGSLLATASLEHRAGDQASVATVEIPAGDGREIEATLDAAHASDIAVGRSLAFQVRRNQTVNVQISLQPVIRTLYGGGTQRGDGGPAVSAKFNQPQRLSIGPDGTLYVPDKNFHALRAIGPDGIIRTIVGLVNMSGGAVKTTLSPDNTGEGGLASEATAAYPARVLAAPNGDIFYADNLSLSPLIIRVHLIPAHAGSRFGGDVLPGHVYTIATFSTAGAGSGLALDADGALIVTEPDANRIHRLGPSDSTTSVLVGGGSQSLADGSLPGDVSLFYPQDVLFDAKGNMLFAEGDGNRIRMLCRVPDRYFGVAMQAGRVYTVMAGDRPNMPWPSDSLPTPLQMALDRAEHLYFVDNSNNAVYRVEHATGAVTLVAGGTKTPSGETTFGDGGPANQASLNLPQGLAIDAWGRLLIGDTVNHRIRALYL